MTATYLNQIIKGTNESPGLWQLEDIANVLGVSLGRLLSTEEEWSSGHTLEDCYRELGRAIQPGYKKITLMEAITAIDQILSAEERADFAKLLKGRA